jgi:hypothetical protein
MNAKTRKPPIPLESEVQKACIARLKSLGLEPFRRNVMAMSGVHKGKPWHVRNGKKGQSDLWWILPDGRHCEFETKRLGEKPTADQIAWLKSTNQITGASYWADNAETCEFVAQKLMEGYRVSYVTDGLHEALYDLEAP